MSPPPNLPLRCIARIFTTISENTGAAMLRQYVIALILNAIIVAQILFYTKKKWPSSAGRRASKAVSTAAKKK